MEELERQFVESDQENVLLNATFAEVNRLSDENAQLRARVEELEAVAESATGVIPYVTATLSSVLADCRKTGERWGQAHGGRSYSSINQLEALLAKARAALEEGDV